MRMPLAIARAAVVAGVLALLAAPARAQSAEAPAAGNGARGDTIVRGTTANESLRQRWASPFAVEGSGQTAPREPRAHVTWLAPDSGRRTSASTRAGARTQRPDTTRRAAAPATPAPAAARPRTHTVARGETFLGIARRYGVTQDALRAANPGVEWEHVRIGVVLRIPAAPAASSARPATRAATPARTTARVDTAKGDTADDAAPPRPARRDSTARPANARRDSAVTRPAAPRPTRRDSTAARTPSRRDSAAARTPTARRDSSSTTRRTPAAPRDTVVIGGKASAPRDTLVVGRRPAPARRDSAASRTQSPARSDASGTRRHTVAAGESLFSIARRYGVPAQRIRDVNGLTDDRLRVGQVLVIPPGA